MGRMKIVVQTTFASQIISKMERTVEIKPWATGSDKIPKSIIVAEGDVIIGSAANTPIRLEKGSADDQLVMGASNRPIWQTPAGGSLTDVDVMNCRLSLSATDPVTTADQTAKDEVYIHPFMGDKVFLYTGSQWLRRTLAKHSIKITDAQSGTTSNGSMVITGLSDTSKLCEGMEVTGTGVGASALIASIDSATQITTDVNSTADGTVTVTFKVPADTNIDYFLFDVSGTPTLRMILWTDATTRASALTTLNGRDVLDSENEYIYVGSGRTTDTEGETADALKKRFCINHYNALPRPMGFVDDTGHSYATAAWRQMRGQAANKVEFIIGVSKQIVKATQSIYVSSGGGDSSHISIGLDAVNAVPTGALSAHFYNSADVFQVTMNAIYRGLPGIGYHYLAPIEYAHNGAIGYSGVTNFHLFEGEVYG